MHWSCFLSATVLFGTLTGCTTYSPKDVSPATSLGHFESRTLQDAGLHAFLAQHGAATTGEWELNRLTLAAFYFNPDLAVARAQAAEAQAGVRTAQSWPNPSFNFTPGYDKDAIGGITPWILGYALSLPLEVGGKRRYRTEEARQQAEAARLNLASAAWTTRTSVRKALAELHAAEAMATYWREQQPLLARSSQLVQAQVEAGEVSPLLAAQARIALSRAELSIRENERATVSARSRLAEAIGVPLTALADIPLSYRGLADAGVIEAADARRWAAQYRPDLLASLAAYAASQAALQGEIARQYPDLAIGPGYQLDQGEGKWSLSLGFTLPVFNQSQGPIAAALARREMAAARFVSVQGRVLAEVDRAAADYRYAVGDLDTAKTLRGNIGQQLTTLRAQETAGEISGLELVRTQLELADAMRAELESQIRAEIALAALEHAIQRPLAWSADAWSRSAGSN